MRILWQLQLSNYNNGRFNLSGDSNWTVFLSKASQLIKLNPDIHIDVLLPLWGTCDTDYYHELMIHGLTGSVDVIQVNIARNALVTRYDFPFNTYLTAISTAYNYDVVYINDPCLSGNFRAVFQTIGYMPKFISQCHFLDTPFMAIVPETVSYWHRTIEACVKSDLFIWHCESQEEFFQQELQYQFTPEFIENLMEKSFVWKSGHSLKFLQTEPNINDMNLKALPLEHNTKIVWVPNRVGGLGISLDYTNNGKFLFEEVNKLERDDFVVLAGNPNQKIPNTQIAELCAKYYYIKDGALNADEYLQLTRSADVVVALYTEDTNGGIAVLEAIHYGAVPLMPNIYEYRTYFDAVDWPAEFRVAEDLSDVAEVLDRILDNLDLLAPYVERMGKYIDENFSIEATTNEFYERLTSL